MLLATADPFPWLALLGRAHPVLLHLPLGLLPAMALLEFGAALLRRPTPRGPILALAWFCAVTAALATASGLQLATEADGGGETLGYHKIAGIALGSLCLLAAFCAFAARRGAFRVVLLAACAAMFVAGHLGGSITHGPGFLLEPLERARAAPDPGEPAVGDAAQGEFARVILPILERTCTECHNPDKAKADLVLTTAEGLRRGGELGPVLVPGKPEESELWIRCEYPLDDEDHMPPADKPQPTAEELAALRTWIAAGAKFD